MIKELNRAGKASGERGVFGINDYCNACNIHGIYIPVEKKFSDKRVLLKFGHFQQYGVNLFRSGDEIRFFDNETMASYAYATVKSSQFMSAKNIILETNENLPEICAKIM